LNFEDSCYLLIFICVSIMYMQLFVLGAISLLVMAFYVLVAFCQLVNTVTKHYDLPSVKGRLPCDWGVQTLWSVCEWQVKPCTHGPGACLTSRCCPA